MKVIIDIPDNIYDAIKKMQTIVSCQRSGKTFLQILVNSVENGTPLDDVKEQMKKTRRFHVGNFEDDNPIDYGIVEGFDEAIEILDRIGKESEE